MCYKDCRNCGRPMTEVFCKSRRIGGIVYYPKRSKCFHFWVCGYCQAKV